MLNWSFVGLSRLHTLQLIGPGPVSSNDHTTIDGVGRRPSRRHGDHDVMYVKWPDAAARCQGGRYRWGSFGKDLGVMRLLWRQAVHATIIVRRIGRRCWSRHVPQWIFRWNLAGKYARLSRFMVVRYSGKQTDINIIFLNRCFASRPGYFHVNLPWSELTSLDRTEWT